MDMFFAVLFLVAVLLFIKFIFVDVRAARKAWKKRDEQFQRYLDSLPK